MKKLMENREVKLEDLKVGDWVRIKINTNNRYGNYPNFYLNSSILAYVARLHNFYVEFFSVSDYFTLDTSSIYMSFDTTIVHRIQKLSKLEARMLNNIFNPKRWII